MIHTYLADSTKVALHREDNGMGRAWLGDLVFNMEEQVSEPENPEDGSRGARTSTLSKRDTTGKYLKVAKNVNLRGPEEDEEEGAYYSFESTPYAGGRIEANGTSAGLTVRKFVTDHLGSVRAIVTDNAVVERNDYYPFGGRHDNATLPTLTTNRYGFTGKERQNISTGLDPNIDFGARFYDPLTARWLSPDPMADKYTSLTQYNYCGGDPVNFVDPDGMEKIVSLKLKSPKSSSYRSIKAFRVALNEYKQNTSLKEQIDKVEDYDNITILYAHGSANNSVSVINDNGIKEYLNSRALSDFILDNSSIVKTGLDQQKGSIIVLNSCKTGKDEHSIAAGLSLQLEGSVIIAPSGNSTPDGSVRGFKARWNVFYKGKIINHFRGTSEDYSKMLNRLNEHQKQMFRVLNHEEK